MNRTPTMIDIYVFADPKWASVDLSGFHVEALDGEIGSIDQATYQLGADFIVCDTGPWIFGKKVLLPVGVINQIDVGDHRVFVNLTKDQIKNAPEFDESRLRDHAYRDELGTYYGANRPAGPDYGKSDQGF